MTRRAAAWTLTSRPKFLQQWADTASPEEFEQARREIDRAIDALGSAPDRFFFLDEEHSRSHVLAWFRDAQAAFAVILPPGSGNGHGA